MPSLPASTTHRYLWAQGTVSTVPGAGAMLAGRYRVVQFPLLVDTAPDEPPTPLASVPVLAEPYLLLSAFPTAIPKPFTQITLSDAQDSLLLLEEPPIQVRSEDGAELPVLLPPLPAAWPEATALQQLTWLWQLATLWQPCIDHQVGATLLDWQAIRVDSEDVRLLTLQKGEPAPSLQDLAHQWQPLVQAAAKPVRSYLSALVESLAAGQGSAQGLVHSLTEALAFIAADCPVSVHLATQSDQGPTRSRNEDACYPDSGATDHRSLTANTVETHAAPFVIVCDGIGGHQGGDIASRLAIQSVTQQLQGLSSVPQLTHEEVAAALEKAILTANQSILARNDAAQSQNRDRMGTTIVLALAYGACLYIAHLGDSRAYRIRPDGCRQITLDDDVAAREMRLGLRLYQDALQTAGSGALVQALGTADARHLHPTVRLYPLTTPAVFVLCSDGLSDYGLLDHLWVSELQPVLAGTQDVATASRRLIELANTHNGHDNVTVAVMRAEPQPFQPKRHIPTDLVEGLTNARQGRSPVTQPPPTEIAPPQRRRGLPLLLASFVTAVLLGLGAIYAWQRFVLGGSDRASEPDSGEALSPVAAPPTATPSSPALDLSVGDYLQIQGISETAPLIATATPPVPLPPPAVGLPTQVLPTGSVVRVVSRQRTTDDQLWVRLEVCSVVSEAVPDAVGTAVGADPDPARDTPADIPLPVAQPGVQGWLLEEALPNFASLLLDTSPTQKGLCVD